MTEPTEPFTVKSVVSLNKQFTDEAGQTIEGHELLPDPDTEWQPGPLPDEPTWANPPRTLAEAHARAYARERFLAMMMRAPYATRRQGRKRRPLSERDFIRPTDPPLVCERCGKPWARARRGRGPVPRFCPECREASRNAN